MTPHQRIQDSQTEARQLLATYALKSKQIQSQRKAAELYTIPRTTLRRRLRGIQPKHATTPVNLKLSPVEEQSLVQWILDLNRRGFPPNIIDVRRMADVLLAGRG
jgi:hypothetical protein